MDITIFNKYLNEIKECIGCTMIMGFYKDENGRDFILVTNRGNIRIAYFGNNEYGWEFA